jgi:hypothetical protein
MRSLFQELDAEVAQRERAEQERARREAEWRQWLEQPVGRQLPLLTGLSCMEGQLELFPTDGEKE